MTACEERLGKVNVKTMSDPKLSFTKGIAAYLKSFKSVSLHPLLKSWYRKTIVKTAVLAFLLLIIVLTIGIWFIQTRVEDFYSRLLLTGVVAFAGLYFSSTISALLMNSLVLVVGGEKVLRDYFFAGVERSGGMLLKDRSTEVFSAIKSVAFGLFAILFFFTPYTAPFGVLVISLGLGGEALSTAQRLSHEYSLTTRQDQKLIGWKVKMGLGLIPSCMALIPLLGFFFLPVATLAAIELQNPQRSIES
jgi:hypothetical protein